MFENSKLADKSEVKSKIFPPYHLPPPKRQTAFWAFVQKKNNNCICKNVINVCVCVCKLLIIYLFIAVFRYDDSKWRFQVWEAILKPLSHEQMGENAFTPPEERQGAGGGPGGISQEEPCLRVEQKDILMDWHHWFTVILQEFCFLCSPLSLS